MYRTLAVVMVAMVAMACLPGTACATDELWIFSAKGEVDGIPWAYTHRDFDPGRSENEFGLGKLIAPRLTLYASAVRTNADLDYLGLVLAGNKSLAHDCTAGFSLHWYESLDGNADYGKFTATTLWQVEERISAGIACLGSKYSGSDHAYFEIGPMVVVQITESVSGCLEYVRQDGGGEGIIGALTFATN